MTDIVVTRMDKQGRNGVFQVYGVRGGDVLARPVTFFVNRADAEELTRLARTAAATEDLLYAEVDDKAWAFVYTKEAA
jgi:hypothetical protein